jgi:ATP/maltotriose-dependent transcriptional regulator MalT
METHTRLRTGIVGSESLCLVACADPDEAAASRAAALAPEVSTHAFIEALLAECEVDAILIATPHHLLAPISLAALRAGKHVMAEKPIALNEREAAQYLGEALQASLAMQAWLCTLEALTGLAQLPTVPAAVAVQVLVLTGSHPAANRFSRIEASRALAALKDKLVYETFQTAVKQGEALNLEMAVQRLLVEIRPDGKAQAAGMPVSSHIRAVNQALPDPLTPRELEVLMLICTGLSNQQIADHLVVGVSTVKKHINGLYRKLAVTSRSQAILRAQELGLA